jgi:hypothetical protein
MVDLVSSLPTFNIQYYEAYLASIRSMKLFHRTNEHYDLMYLLSTGMRLGRDEAHQFIHDEFIYFIWSTMYHYLPFLHSNPIV